MRSVLLIEDHNGTRDTSAVLLRSAGFHVSTAGDGGSGLAAARATGFDIVVVDIGLPDMSGIDVVRRLVADGNPCIKVVTTAFPWDDVREKAFAAGAAWFVEGLVLGDELGTILKKACMAEADSRATKGRAIDAPPGQSGMQEPVLDRRIATSIRTAAVSSTGASLGSMAATAELSESRFRHVFIQCTNLSVSEYLANLRLQLAARLVAHSETRLADIARTVGWWDVRYFRRLFRSRFGMSPGQYRRAFRSQHGAGTSDSAKQP